jgi:DNA-directed RNA polymerase subunit E"
MTRKVCRKCKIFVKGSECPLCKGSDLTESWQGRINIIDANKSDIAKKINLTIPGEYVIKVR